MMSRYARTKTWWIALMTAAVMAACFTWPVCRAGAAGKTSAPRGAVITNPNTSERLNLREGPSTKSGSLGRYYNGVYVEVLGMEGEWAKVRIGGPPAQYNEGYMMASYLTLDAAPQVVPSGMTQAATHMVSSKSPELRDAAKSGSRTLQTFGEGISVVVLGEIGDYSHIFISGQYGYMKRDFLKASSSLPYEPVSPGVMQSYEFGVIHNSDAERGTPLIASPYVESSVLDDLPNGTTVRIEGASGSFTQVTHNGSTGFVLTIDLLPDSSDTSPISVSKINFIDSDSTNPLNLYAYPSTSSALLDTYYTNKRIQMTSLSRAGAYWRVEMDEGKAGYIKISEQPLQFGSDAIPDKSKQYGVIIVPDPTTRLNVRSTASASAAIKDKLYGGVQVEILERIDSKSQGWCKIGYGNGLSGYVQQQFVLPIIDIKNSKDWVR